MNPKSTKETYAARPAAERETNIPVEIAGAINNGVQRTIQVQKNALDLAAEQQVELFDLYKKSIPSSAPAASLFDFAVQAFGSFVQTQKAVLDLLGEQSNAVLEHIQQRGESVASVAKDFNSLVTDSMERAAAAQKIVLDYAAQQNKAASEAIKQQPGVPGTPAAAAADSVQRSVESMISSQKEILDAATKPLKSTASA